MADAAQVRIGYAFGTRTRLNDDGFATVVDALERLGFDSLWLSERIGGDAPDPLVGMAFAAGRTTRLKFGMSVMVLPGRNPIVLAKELATLDRLSNGRLLPAFGLGVADPHEQQAFGVERGARAKLFDEALAVLRGAWAEGTLTHHGEHFDYDDLRVLPKPLQAHLDVWLGGIAPSELRTRRPTGRRMAAELRHSRRRRDADGRSSRRRSAEHDRTIDADHYGALISYSLGPVPHVGRRPAGQAASRPRRPDGARAAGMGRADEPRSTRSSPSAPRSS